MTLSEHALNGDKVVIDFLSTLESATSWLDMSVMYVLCMFMYVLCMRFKSKFGRECKGPFN